MNRRRGERARRQLARWRRRRRGRLQVPGEAEGIGAGKIGCAGNHLHTVGGESGTDIGKGHTRRARHLIGRKYFCKNGFGH